MTVRELIKKWLQIQEEYNTLAKRARKERKQIANDEELKKKKQEQERQLEEAWTKANKALHEKECECFTELQKLTESDACQLAARLMISPEACSLMPLVFGRLGKIELRSSSAASTTYRALLEVLLEPNKLLHDFAEQAAQVADAGPLLQELSPKLGQLRDSKALEIETIDFKLLFKKFNLKSKQPVLILNRTAIFPTTSGGLIAFKIQKGLPKIVTTGQTIETFLQLKPPPQLSPPLKPYASYENFEPEPAGELVRENLILGALNTHKKALGLKSKLPLPQGVYVIENFPLDCSDGNRPLPRQDQGSEKSIFIWEGGKVVAYIYETDSADYFTYLIDKDLSETDFTRARDEGFHDLYCLARAGLFSTALADLFHARVSADNVEFNRITDGLGRYRVLNDLLDVREMKLSFRGFGTGKLGTWMQSVEFINLRKSGIADFADFMTVHECVDKDSEFRRRFFYLLEDKKSYQSRILVNLLVEPLLVYELVTARRRVEHKQLDSGSAAHVTCVGFEVLHGLALALSVYTGCPYALAKSLFASTIDFERLGRQVNYFMSTDHAARFELQTTKLPRKLYEADCQVIINLNDLISGVLRATYHRCLRVGTGSGFSDNWKDPDLGPFSGPNPSKEAERARFCFGAFALLIQRGMARGAALAKQGREANGPQAAIPLLRQSLACWPFDPDCAALLVKQLLADSDEIGAQLAAAEAAELALKVKTIEREVDQLTPVVPPFTVDDRSPRTPLAKIQRALAIARKEAEGLRIELRQLRLEKKKEKKKKGQDSTEMALLRKILAIDPFDAQSRKELVQLLFDDDRKPESNQVKSEFGAEPQDDWLRKHMNG